MQISLPQIRIHFRDLGLFINSEAAAWLTRAVSSARRGSCWAPRARVAVVVSAMQGVTNALFALLDRAVAGDEKWQDDLDALQERYSAVSEELISDPERRAALLEAQAGECRDVADILHSAVLIRSAGPRMEALVSGCGELWSARCWRP